MIQSFKCKDALALYEGKSPRRFKSFASVAEAQGRAVGRGADAGLSEGTAWNRLEALKGDRKGQHCIRTNDQWRVCFVWTEVGPANVEIVDYH